MAHFPGLFAGTPDKIEQEFCSLWQECCFYRPHPLYQIRLELHRAGAVFGYIEFLTGVFLCGTKFSASIHREMLARARKRLKKDFSKNGLADTVDRQNARIHLAIARGQAMASLRELQATLEFLMAGGVSSSRVQGFSNRIQAEIEAAVSARDDALIDSFASETGAEAPVEIQSPELAAELFELFMFRDFLVQLYQKIGMFHRPEKSGQPDPLGTFLLLAVNTKKF